MKRNNILPVAVLASGILVVTLSTQATSQISAKPSVVLQSSSPGTPQSGNANISGLFTSGGLQTQSFKLGTATTAGWVLTTDAFGNATWAPLSLSLPYAGSGSSTGCLFKITNTGTGHGICGFNTYATGPTVGVFGSAASPDGIGVKGLAALGVQGYSTTPNGTGVAGYANGSADAWGVSGETTTGQAVIGRAGTNLPGGGFPGGTGVVGFANGATGTGVWAQSTQPGGTGLVATNTANSGNAFGIVSWTSSNTGHAIKGIAVMPTGQTVGVEGEVSSTSGWGVFGNATATSGSAYGGWFQTTSPNGAGLLATNLSNTGPGTGIHAVTNSPNGFGVRGESFMPNGSPVGVQGQVAAAQGIGVVGISTHTTGGGIGVLGRSANSGGEGVRAENTSPSGYARGVTGLALSTYGAGVVGEATAVTGPATGIAGVSYSDGGYGVYGSALNSAPNTATYGVAGYSASTYANSFAVFAFGRVGATGLKPFRIDHPLDPENKYLYHYSSEGPEPLNLYRGNVTTDANGEAWVQLPNYYDEINRDPSYHLTVVDESDDADFTMVKVARKIEGNRFKIRTSRPRIQVSWEVAAVRNDRWVQRYGAPVETDKDASEKGTYQHPELYGQPESRGVLHGMERTQTLRNPR